MVRPAGAVRLELVPITLIEARAFVDGTHRKLRAPVGGLFALAASDGSRIRAVAIVSRPVARRLDDSWTAEVTRLASDGIPNAPSFLYRAAWRAARALGYRRLVTYTLRSEPGTSLRAAGLRDVGTTRAQSWSREGRPRVDRNPAQEKIRWELP